MLIFYGLITYFYIHQILIVIIYKKTALKEQSPYILFCNFAHQMTHFRNDEFAHR